MMRTCVGSVCLMVVLVACGDDDDVVRSIDSGIDASNDDANVTNPGDDAAIEGTFQCGQDAGLSVETPDGWFATRTTLDVWWEHVSTRDPGRGEIEIYTLSQVEDGQATTKVCGITLPPYTSDVGCEAFLLTIPDEAWESHRMPRFIARANVDADAGKVAFNAATALIGVDFLNGHEDDAWPTSTMTGAITCEAGTGSPCYADHDNDTFAGITAHARIDGATYVGPYDNGLCTSGTPFTYGGLITSLDIGSGDPGGYGPRADQVRIGLRTRVLGPGATGSDCTASFDLRAFGCTVDPTTLGTAVTRPASGTTPANACKPEEAQHIDDFMPAYQVLAAGQSPAPSSRPLGWILGASNRDIDKRPSAGTRSTFVRLAELSEAEPTCAQVRAAAFRTW